MEEELKLNAGESLRVESSDTKGFMGETDITEYAVIDPNGNKVGSVVHTVHTAVKGFRVTHSVVQRDSAGSILVDESWRG